MRSSTLLSLLCVASIAACANSRFYGVEDAGDGGGNTDPSMKGDGGSSSGSGDARADRARPPDDDDEEPVEACAPGSVSGFTPQWIPPTSLAQGVCSPTQATTLVDCLFGFGNATTCDAFLSAPGNEPCMTCALTASTAPSYGPLVVTDDSLVSLNISGCIARLVNDIGASSCGAKVQASAQCGNAACAANCPVPDGDDQALVALNDCYTEADETVCSSYADEALCADALAAAAPCADGTSFEALAEKYITLFCGD